MTSPNPVEGCLEFREKLGKVAGCHGQPMLHKFPLLE